LSELKSTLLASGLVMPEGPRWHDDKLWISDVYGKRVVTCDAEGVLTTVAEVPNWPSGLGFRGDQVLVTSMNDGLLLQVSDDGSLDVVADLSSYADGTNYWGCLINDMAVDGRGNAYIGTYGAGPNHDSTGIVLVRPDGTALEVADGIAGANGIVITPDYSTLIIAELDSDHLTAFDIAADGTLNNSRVWARVPGSTPDGICLDAEGAVWFGSVYTHEFFRVAEGGKVLDHIQLDKCGMAPILGGPSGTTLYLCTAETSKEQLARGEAKGFIEYVEVDVPGAGWP
jgi:sugar lactone lactonase YvrE